MRTASRDNASPSKRLRRVLGGTIILACVAFSSTAAGAASPFSFALTRNGALPAGCADRVAAGVKIKSLGFAERLTIVVSGFAPHTKLDFFVIQVPKAPFGISWYLGDVETNGSGRAVKNFVSRLNIETFAVAPGTAPAPLVFNGDGSSNPAFPPIQTYHLGLWFNSPADAQANGITCPATVTPFNGEHNAGVQVLNSASFPDDFGPLRHVE